MVTIAEIELGISRQHVNPVFAQQLADTVGIARRWGWLATQLRNKQLDLAIAATALDATPICAGGNSEPVAVAPAAGMHHRLVAPEGLFFWRLCAACT